MLKRTMLSMLPMAALVMACGTSSGPLTVDSITGDAGVSGTPMVVQSTVAVGNANCPNGGTEIQAGLDTNNDGMLDVVSSTTFVCNGLNGTNGANGMDGVNGTNGVDGMNGATGAVGPQGPAGEAGPQGPVGPMGAPGANGVSSLVVQSTLPVGNTSCPNGGVEVQSGLDTNADMVLEASEVLQTSFICNGLNGANGANGVNGLSASATTIPLQPGDTNCPYGGTEVIATVVGSPTTTSFSCNGAPGAQGPQGDAGAVGPQGPSGLISLINQIPVAEDEFCPTGGTIIQSGVDTNGNGVLDPNEVTQATEVCNGAVGPQGPQGPQGPAGDAGATGPQGPQGGSTYILNAALQSGDPNCPFGGTSFTAYYVDGLGDPPYPGNTTYACNGAPGEAGADGVNGEAGATGATGEAGANGSSAFVQTATLSVGDPNCAYGGVSFSACVQDAQGDPPACSAPSYVCNGAPGATGATGEAGAAGPQGPAGEAGATGPQGPQGPAGEAGAPGGTINTISGIVVLPDNNTCAHGGTATETGVSVANDGGFTFVVQKTVITCCPSGTVVNSTTGVCQTVRF